VVLRGPEHRWTCGLLFGKQGARADHGVVNDCWRAAAVSYTGSVEGNFNPRCAKEEKFSSTFGQQYSSRAKGIGRGTNKRATHFPGGAGSCCSNPAHL